MNRIQSVAAMCVLAGACGTAAASVAVTGAEADRTKFAEELTKCSGGAKVTVKDGKLVIEDGGNAYAGLLRDMITGGTAITADIVNKDPTVFVGSFVPSVRTDADGNTKTSDGVQKIDIDDCIKIKELTKDDKLPFSPSTWGALIHELTECYSSRKDGLVYNDAHKKGIDAENVAYALENTGTQRQQDSFTVPPKPAEPKGGGWRIFMPAVNTTLGLGYWTYDWEVVGGFGNQTPFDMGFFGVAEVGKDGLVFEGDQIELTGVDWTPVPAPGSLAVAAGALVLLRRKRA